MRTTIDIPDELFRRAKSEAALRGRRLKDLVEDGLRLVLEQQNVSDGQLNAEGRKRPTAHDLLKDLIFDDECPSDLATNPKYLDEFGR